MSGDDIIVDSGITEGLDASYSDGDIILKAQAKHEADDNMLTNFIAVAVIKAEVNIKGIFGIRRHDVNNDKCQNRAFFHFQSRNPVRIGEHKEHYQRRQ